MGRIAERQPGTMMAARRAGRVCAWPFLAMLHGVRRFKISRYLLVGVTCAALNNGLIIGLASMGANYIVASVAAFGPVAITAYLLHTSFTFEKARSAIGFFRYVLAQISSFFVGLAAMSVFCDLFGASVAVAAPSATLIAFLWNYASAHWAIASRKNLSATT
jgi:putative flippase GtrA